MKEVKCIICNGYGNNGNDDMPCLNCGGNGYEDELDDDNSNVVPPKITKNW